MIDNTSKFIPYNSVSPILLGNEDYPDYPFFSGTGFFVVFPPYEDIYFVTARHCVIDNMGNPIGAPIVHFASDGECRKSIPFECRLETKYEETDEYFEDIVVYVVGDISEDEKTVLRARALKLQHQDNVEVILDSVVTNNGNLRTVGFPSVSKYIDYDKSQAISQSRGFYFKACRDNDLENQYKLVGGSWKDGELDGFSGSPIIELLKTTEGNVQSIPVGILLTESYFISINVATNLIAEYIKNSHGMAVQS